MQAHIRFMIDVHEIPLIWNRTENSALTLLIVFHLSTTQSRTDDRNNNISRWNNNISR